MVMSDREYQELIPKVESVLKEFLGHDYPTFKTLCEVNVAHSGCLRRDAIPYVTGSFRITEEGKEVRFEVQVDLARMKVVEGSFSEIE